MDGNGKLQIDDEHAIVVRKIFDLTIAGQPASGIATALNTDGVPSPTGGKWTRGSISALLRRPAYIGEVHFAKSRKCEPKLRRKAPRAGKSKATSSKPTPRDTWITIPCPPILERTVWDRAQARIDEIRIGRSGRPSLSYLLRGLLRCKCGSSLTGCESHQRNYYRCCGHAGFEKRRYCGQKGLRVEAVEPKVWQEVVDTLSDPAKLAALYNSHHAELTAKAENREAERAALEAQIAKLAKRAARAQQALLDVDLADSFESLRNNLKTILAEKRQLQVRLDALQPAAAVATTDFTDICDAMQGAARLEDREQQRQFLQAAISRIDVDGADLRIVFAVNFEAILAILSSQPVGPGSSGAGMGRNCISLQRRQIPRSHHSRGQTCLLLQCHDPWHPLRHRRSAGRIRRTLQRAPRRFARRTSTANHR